MSSSITEENDQIISYNESITVNHNPDTDNDHIFYAQVSGDANNNGGYDGDGKIAVTLEAKNITLDSDIISELKLNETEYQIELLLPRN